MDAPLRRLQRRLRFRLEWLRGPRPRKGVDRRFVLSGHADWPGLQLAIGATGAECVIVTHGQIEPMVCWLREQGLDAGAFRTEYGDDAIEADTAENDNTNESAAT